jgi:CubicO group peptidase (beta-lactamase class C family)
MKKSSFSEVGSYLKPLLKKGVEQGVFSGAAVGLYRQFNKEGEKKIFCCGKTTKYPGALPIKENTLFDLASLTKPLCTVLTILHLVETKKISWETTIGALFGTKTPAYLKKIQIAHLLSHSSGIKEYAAFYRDFHPSQKKENRNKLLTAIFKEKPVCGAGEKCLYSDLGYILLGEIIEKVSGEKLDDIFTAKITKPLCLNKEVMFRPIDMSAPPANKKIAATQYCPWRQRLLQGEVDDEHCWLMGGVAGHAGLFGSVQGVLDLTVHILHEWQGREEHPAYSNTLLQKALTRPYNNQSWCLGFDTPSQAGSSAGNYISKESVGHLGFTGTSFWIDPIRDMVIVLLTNRIHPTRENETIKTFRPQLHDTIIRTMESG